MIKQLVLSFTLIAFSVNLFSQSTASANASATIVAPIAISNIDDMNFGNVAVINAGTVILAPNSSRTATGGVTLPNVTGTVSAASFQVSGEGNYTYSITLPSTDYIVTRVSGSETMAVNTFTSTPTVAAGGQLNDGTQVLNVGATLNVATGQVPGVYTGASGFDVTVNYN